MGEQVGLFDQPVEEPVPGGTHHHDPETSRAAATSRKNQLRWGTQRYNLLLAFQGRQDGLTPDRAGEMAHVTGYSQRRRCSELEASGHLEPTGDVIDGQRVLRITEEGGRALRGAKRDPNRPRYDYAGERTTETDPEAEEKVW